MEPTVSADTLGTGVPERLRGRCSGIPKCCIDYFVTIWIGTGLWRTDAGQATRAREPSNVRYIRCPDCRDVDRRYTVRKCKRGCLCDPQRPRRVISTLHSPTFARRWQFELDCGHIVHETLPTPPRRKTMRCPKCSPPTTTGATP